jgi:hypothetical protein
MASVEKLAELILSVWHITGKAKINNVINVTFHDSYFMFETARVLLSAHKPSILMDVFYHEGQSTN